MPCHVSFWMTYSMQYPWVLATALQINESKCYIPSGVWNEKLTQPAVKYAHLAQKSLCYNALVNVKLHISQVGEGTVYILTVC